MSGAITPADVPLVYSRLAHATEEVRAKKEKQVRDTLNDRLELTEWKFERPNLVLDFSSSSRLSHALIPYTSTLENVPHPSQEFIVVEELLKVFIGCESDYIVAQDIGERQTKREFIINQTIDKQNCEFIKKCLPMASSYSIVARFVEENLRLATGRVNQALADSLDHHLGQFMIFIEALESKHRTKNLHMHELWFHIQNNFSTLKLLSDIASEVAADKTRGGQTLTILHEKLTKMIATFTIQINICRRLTTQSSVPFLHSVKQWIFNGVIYDPFDEFMVVENPKWKMKDVYSEGYWEMMYQLRPTLIPSFLQDVQYHILNSGKYINVIRECVKSESEMNLAPIEDLIYSDDKTYNDVIMKAYKHSSKHLLDYMLNEYSLMERITTAKRYFLLQQGDFVVQILDTCHEELDKDINEVNPSRLAALVEMAIRLSSIRPDPFIEQFTTHLKPLDLASQVKKILVDCIPSKGNIDHDSSISDEHVALSGYESVMLKMNCDWPVSLIFNYKVQSVYQMLFRHLFYCKYVERLLGNTWLLGQSLRGISYPNMKPYMAVIALRNRMQFFLQNMQYYMMEEAIEPAWAEFIEVVKVCDSIDDLMKCHWNFLEKCTQDCLLTNLELLFVFRHILGLCQQLGTFLSEIGSFKNVVKFPVFPDRINYLEEQFNNSLTWFLTKLTQLTETDSSGKLISLFNRQNYNNFYAGLLGDADMDTLFDSLKNVN